MEKTFDRYEFINHTMFTDLFAVEDDDGKVTGWFRVFNEYKFKKFLHTYNLIYSICSINDTITFKIKQNT